jgi:TonB family protein
MAEAEIACLRCGSSGVPGPDGACARCGAPFKTAQLPRPAVVLPETDPDKLVKRGGAVPVLAAAAAAALALAGGGAWFASRRPAGATRSRDAASASLPSTAAPAPLRRPIAVAAAEADATYAEPSRNAAGADEPRRATNESPGPRAAPQPAPRRTGLEIGSAPVVDPPRAPSAPEPSLPDRPSAALPVQPASVAGPAPAVAGTVPLPPPPRGTELIEDAPTFALEGFQKARMAEPGCVQAAVRLPRDLANRLSGPVTVKFAVGVDGTVGLFQVMGEVPDRRVADALWSAIQSCRFIPGTDAQGRKTRLWVVMPIRFER